MLDFLDKSVNGQLYPTMSKDDDIVKVEVNPISVIFTIGKTIEQLIKEYSHKT